MQKVEHGIGVLWEEYISQELYNLAKKKVQNDLISDLDQLEDWFQNIAENIKDKFNSLSENLMAHFNAIIGMEQESIDQHRKLELKFKQAGELLSNGRQRDSQSNDENKQSLSLYETCTQSSKEEPNGAIQVKKICIACEDHLSEAFGYCSKHQFLQLQLQSKNHTSQNKNYNDEQLREKQLKQRQYLSPENRNHNQSSKKIRKRIQSQQSSQDEQNFEGGLYEVFFGMLESFQL